MADFCAQCARRLGLPEPDIRAEAGKVVWDICEGCGPGWFDENGMRVEVEDDRQPDVAAPGGLQP